jgi:AcrR family transcriptional regulator
MSTPSLFSPLARRVPVQDRAERRVANLLSHAEAVIARVGYEAATMTEIAARAKTSIGSIYQYFPNKEAITVALFRKYGSQLVARWTTLEMETRHLDSEALAAAIIDQFFSFANEQPAFFPILSAPVAVTPDPAVKQRMRGQFAALFVTRNPGLSRDEAIQVAAVTLQTIKSLINLCSEVRPRDRPRIVAEHKVLLAAYLVRRLSGRTQT